MTEPFLYLAPLRGLTDAPFRNLFSSHFRGFDAAVAPFINPGRKSVLRDKTLADVLPENNGSIRVIPQLLDTDSDDFLALAHKLSSLGHDEVNWNLGCPAPMVTRKKRGSGLLPYPDIIVDSLAKIIASSPVKISIKTRLGYFAPSELLRLLPELNRFPLTELIIHARLGKQLYQGATDQKSFAACAGKTNHVLTYNGDINDIHIFRDLQENFPQVNRWMLGRGAIGNPFLAEEIKGMESGDSAIRKERLQNFHQALYEQSRTQQAGPGHLLGKLKQFWTYFGASFPDRQKTYKHIMKSRTPEQYLASVAEIFVD